MQFEGKGTEDFQNGSDVDFPMPATRPQGDLFLFLAARDDDDFDFNSSFTELVNSAGNDSYSRFLAWKTGGASEPASYTITPSPTTTEESVSVALRYSGQHDTTPIGAISTVSTGSSSPAVAPAIVATSNDSLILRVFWADSSPYSGTFSGSGTARARSTRSGSGSMASYFIVEEASPGNTVSTGTITANLNFGESWSTMTVEIMPAAGGAVPIIMQQM